MPRDIEHQHQVALFQWAAKSMAMHPELACMYAIPNGGARHIRTAAKLKAEGVKAGMPDICLPVASGPYHALYVELKAPKIDRRAAGRVSEHQKERMALLEKHGNACLVVYGWDQARVAILAYLGMDVL